MDTEKSLARLILGLIAQSQDARTSTDPPSRSGDHHADLEKAGFELKPASQSNSNKKDKSYE